MSRLTIFIISLVLNALIYVICHVVSFEYAVLFALTMILGTILNPPSIKE